MLSAKLRSQYEPPMNQTSTVYCKAEIKQRHKMTELHNHKKQSLSAKKEPLSMQSVHKETVTLQKLMHRESKKTWKSRDPRTRRQHTQIYS
jgi:uncharacterized protein YaiI (UPF0178 family)